MIQLPREFIAFNTIFIRELRRFLRLWAQTLVPPVITVSLYFVIFGQLIGERIGPMEGHSYIDFVIPGLIMMSVTMSAYNNVVSSFFGAKFTRSVEELLVAPVPYSLILAGYVLGGMVRGLIVGAIVTIVASLFTELQIEHPLILLTMIILASMLFALAGFLNALFARKFDDITIVPTFFLTPLIYLGGVFYSIDLLPEFWAKVSLVNPILYLVNAFRYGFIGVSNVSITLAITMTLLFVVIAIVACLVLLQHSNRVRL